MATKNVFFHVNDLERKEALHAAACAKELSQGLVLKFITVDEKLQNKDLFRKSC